MITIYHLDTSRSERIVWLMEELGLPYEVERYDRTPEGIAPEELRTVHPLGRAPVIRDGEMVLAESGAIVEYILGRYGDGRLSVAPQDPDFGSYLYWLHYAEGSLLLQLLREWSLERMLPDPDSTAGMARVRDTTQLHLSFIEQRLSESSHFGSEDFTAADIMMVFPFTTLMTFRPRDLADYPSLEAYLERIAQRPAYQRAMDLAGPGRKSTDT